jgi:hypothetical protein
MSFRDWLTTVGALLIPFMIAAGGWWITWQQGKIADQRAEADRELAAQRAQDEALQAYLDQMSTLMLENNLRSSTEKGKEARTLARARTLAVLGSLGSDLEQRPDRKRTVLEFLYQASLIGDAKNNSYVDLRNANLDHAYLYYANLKNASLSFVSLKGANLYHANLYDAELGGAIICCDADLSGANLRKANLHTADLSNANLSGADLRGVFKLNNTKTKTQRITNEELEQQARQARSLKGATMPNVQKYEDWTKSRGKGG